MDLDPANFLLYDTDEPVSALECLARRVRGVHCKDGLCPEQNGVLGRPVGQGGVNFPVFVRKLIDTGSHGLLVIEREQGPNVIQEIMAARVYLEGLLSGADYDGRAVGVT